MQRSLLKSIALVFTSLIFCAVTLEVGVRLWGYSDKYMYDPIYRKSEYPSVGYEHKPGARGMGRSSTHVRIDNIGARAERDYAISKPEAACRVVLLGDSFTFGQGVEVQETYAHLLENGMLSRKLGGKKVEVVNLAVCGYNLENMVGVFEHKALQLSPDVAVLAIIPEDLSPDRRLTADEQGYTENVLTPWIPGPLKTLLRRSHAAYWLRDMWWRLTDAGGAGMRAVLDESAPGHDETWAKAARLLDSFARLARADSVVPILFDLSLEKNRASRKLQELSRKLEIDYVGVPLESVGDSMDLVIPRDGHPNEKGHALYAEILLQPLLKALISSGCTRE